MNFTRYVIPALVAALALPALAAAESGEGGGDALRVSLVASAAGDAAIHGVAPAGDWRLRRGSVRIKRDDDEVELRVEISRLVLRSTGRTGGVESVRAAFFCGGVRADITAAARLSRRGDARIRTDVDAPRRCLAPTVLVSPNGNDRVFVAAAGFLD